MPFRDRDQRHFGLVAERFNLLCERRRELRVDEKAQSCAPQDWVIVLLGRELQDRSDVLGFKVGIVRQNLVTRGACSEEIQDVFYSDAEPTNARTTATHIGPYRDPVDRAHTAIVARRGLPQRSPFTVPETAADAACETTAGGSVSMDFDPRDYDSRDDERHPNLRAVEVAAAPASAIVMTTRAIRAEASLGP